MGARAEAAEQTASRIHAAAVALFRSRPFPDVTLQAVADQAGVTLQTVLRKFGSKEQLFAAAALAVADDVMESRRVLTPGDVPAIVRTIVASYETMGDLGWRGLTQEDHIPLIKARLDDARARHRVWVEACFPDVLRVRGTERDRRVDLLCAATDFYVWKLYRRDLARSRAATTARMIDLVEALIVGFRRP